jgi:predicted nucleotidyltransferase
MDFRVGTGVPTRGTSPEACRYPEARAHVRSDHNNIATCTFERLQSHLRDWSDVYLREVATTSEQVLETLSLNGSRLAELGVSSLFLFGSVARGEARPDSDVDLLVDFDGPATFDRYMQLKFFLEDLLQRRVDLLTRQAVRPELRHFIEQDARRVA